MSQLKHDQYFGGDIPDQDVKQTVRNWGFKIIVPIASTAPGTIGANTFEHPRIRYNG